MKFIIYKDTSSEWRWRLKAKNGRVIADSAEGYGNREDCEAGIELVREAWRAPVSKGRQKSKTSFKAL